MNKLILIMISLLVFNSAQSAFFIPLENDSASKVTTVVDYNIIYSKENFVLLKDNTIVKFKTTEYKKNRNKKGERFFDGVNYPLNDILAYQYHGYYYIRVKGAEDEFMCASIKAKNPKQISYFETNKIVSGVNGKGQGTYSIKNLYFIQKYIGSVVMANKRNVLDRIDNDETLRKELNVYFEEKNKITSSLMAFILFGVVGFIGSFSSLMLIGDEEYGEKAAIIALILAVEALISLANLGRARKKIDKIPGTTKFINMHNQLNKS